MAALGGCSTRTVFFERVERPSLTLLPGEYHHVPLDLTDYERRQFNLQYEVTAAGSFDALLFGGETGATGFREYVDTLSEGASDRPLDYSERHSVPDASGSASVNVPLGRGVHHLVVDNTDAGPVPAGSGGGPGGRLEASLELAVRDFELGLG